MVTKEDGLETVIGQGSSNGWLYDFNCIWNVIYILRTKQVKEGKKVCSLEYKKV